MFFAIGFLFFFTLDILLFFRFRFLGMVPVSFVRTAICYFTAFILWKERKYFPQEWHRFFTYVWIFYLICISSLRIILEFILYFHQGPSQWNVRKAQFLSLVEKMQWIELFFCLFVLILTLVYIMKQRKESYRWPLFTLFAILFRNLLILLWNPMPVFLYRYFGVVELPAMFGLLMIIVTMVRKVYGFQEIMNYRE